MTGMTSLISKTIVLPQRDIDTDQIIPARFLTTTAGGGFADAAFHDWRFDENGLPRNNTPFAVNPIEGFRILVAGANFGCGSSREHAAWALRDFGFRAVISSDLADIFRSNALKNGLIAIEVDLETHAYLLANPGAEITIDLERCEIDLPNGSRSFSIEPFARRCILAGVDQLGFILSKEHEICAYEGLRR